MKIKKNKKGLTMPDDLFEKIEKILPSIQGWCCLAKAQKLAQVIVDRKPDLCIEIGVFGGSSLIPQALALQDNQKGVIFGIDPWQTDAALEHMIDEANKVWWNDLNLESIYKHCLKNIENLSLENHCKLLRNKSEEVVNSFEDQSVDLLHIDGNHSEPLSYRDATLYLPKVKSGGIIFFDDIWWTEGDNQVTTRKAILYLFEHCKKIDVINNDCLVLEKN